MPNAVPMQGARGLPQPQAMNPGLPSVGGLSAGQPLQLSLAPELQAAARSAHRHLLDDGTALYLLAFDTAQFDPGAFAAMAIARPDSIARSVRKRQAEFLFGRLAARLALQEVLGPAQAQADIAIGATRAPCWPAGSLGSISHCEDYAAAIAMAAGTRHGVGIDLERPITPAARAALLSIAIDADEAARLATAADAQWPHDLLLTALFSAKESLFKAAYSAVGRYFDFSAARLCGIDLARQCLHLRLTETLCAQFVARQVCEVGFARLPPDLVLTHYAW
ncbi:4'-phosphopantetheinyl transferase family protein [Xanthomonas albilineans]|uniref:4'-phosphopantetheinyl transferase family protein n=1 Tax=Xanthomonas albilineans TaxID=29447 RepID=UPI000B209E93|nr:4'-phosphopantetheinyl transferase superfamily protein [Xanthomonas albilineans]